MFKWFKQLQAELDAIPVSSLESPDTAVRRDEIAIDVLKDVNLRKLFTLRSKLRDELDALKNETMHLAVDVVHSGKDQHGDGDNCPMCKILMKGTLLSARYGQITSLMWAAIRAELTEDQLAIVCKDGYTMGLRKDWQIAAIPVRQERGIEILDGFVIPAGALSELLKQMRGR